MEPGPQRRFPLQTESTHSVSTQTACSDRGSRELTGTVLALQWGDPGSTLSSGTHFSILGNDFTSGHLHERGPTTPSPSASQGSGRIGAARPWKRFSGYDRPNYSPKVLQSYSPEW